jgi:arsenate reductase
MNSPSRKSKRTRSIVVFVCEHGAAKSIIAAAHFNRLADKLGLDVRAIARATNPENELSSQAVQGLLEDDLTPTELFPRKLTGEEARSAKRLVSFCELPSEYQNVMAERWGGIPPVNENYEKARDAIIERIQQLLKHEV